MVKPLPSKQKLRVRFPLSAPKPAGVTPGYCDPQEGEMSSSLMGGSSLTELALAMRQSSLVVKWMEGVVRGYKPDAHTIVTTAERKHPCPFRIMVLHLFCNQDTAVRFCQGAPSLRP
jgi:hypothetical protein